MPSHAALLLSFATTEREVDNQHIQQDGFHRIPSAGPYAIVFCNIWLTISN